MSLARKAMADYPISEKARDRIRSARVRDLMFEVRRILSGGGYSEPEVSAITEAMVEALQSGDELTYDFLVERLMRRRVPASQAEELAKEFAD